MGHLPYPGTRWELRAVLCLRQLLLLEEVATRSSDCLLPSHPLPFSFLSFFCILKVADTLLLRKTRFYFQDDHCLGAVYFLQCDNGHWITQHVASFVSHHGAFSPAQCCHSSVDTSLTLLSPEGLPPIFCLFPRLHILISALLDSCFSELLGTQP